MPAPPRRRSEGALLLLVYSAGLGIPFSGRGAGALAGGRRAGRGQASPRPAERRQRLRCWSLLGALFLFNQSYLLAYLSVAQPAAARPLLRRSVDATDLFWCAMRALHALAAIGLGRGDLLRAVRRAAILGRAAARDRWHA